ncbi:hypothetical protein GMI70_06980 [Eggerthellaceae bacterium zg-893]|nr:hypothetical protein [Eggerthellaceae bacterium zg-893]
MTVDERLEPPPFEQPTRDRKAEARHARRRRSRSAIEGAAFGEIDAIHERIDELEGSLSAEAVAELRGGLAELSNRVEKMERASAVAFEAAEAVERLRQDVAFLRASTRR